MAPVPSRMSPTAFSTTSAPTTMSPRRTAHVPTPPFMARRGPSALPTVAPVPAPTVPSGTSVDAAPHARYASSRVGQPAGLPPRPPAESEDTAGGGAGDDPPRPPA